MSELLRWTAERAIKYQQELNNRSVAPTIEAINRLKEFDTTLQDEPIEADAVLRLLEEIGSPATVAMTGGRYFGFVNGGSLPAAHAASWLVTVWQGQTAMRISISSWATTEEDVERSLAAIIRIARENTELE